MTDADHSPAPLSGRSLRIGVLGCGGIARTAHLPAYQASGMEVSRVWSRRREVADKVLAEHPWVGGVADTVEDLLSDPGIDIVDIATPLDGRLDLVERALKAGKHVLAQKPLATDLGRVEHLIGLAEERGLHIAVNQNARWAPAWRAATLLVERGDIGSVVGVTHLHDKPLPPLVGTPFDDLDHMLITDYLLHWVDITRCWLRGKSVRAVQAIDSRVPGQPDEAKNPWTATVSMLCDDGATASVRIVGNVKTGRPGCPFWVHGTEGTIRGSILGGSDALEIDRGDGAPAPVPLQGQWFVDGFAGTMAELMRAINDGDEPENSARDNLATLRLVAAARESAERSGSPVSTLGLDL